MDVTVLLRVSLAVYYTVILLQAVSHSQQTGDEKRFDSKLLKRHRLLVLLMIQPPSMTQSLSHSGALVNLSEDRKLDELTMRRLIMERRGLSSEAGGRLRAFGYFGYY